MIWSVGALAKALSQSTGSPWEPVELLATEGGLQFSDHKNTLAIVAIDEEGVNVFLQNERVGYTQLKRFDWEKLAEMAHSAPQLH